MRDEAVFLLALIVVDELRIKRQCPKTCHAHKGVYDPAYDSRLTAEDRCHNIKLKQSYEQPVHRAHYYKSKSLDMNLYQVCPILSVIMRSSVL